MSSEDFNVTNEDTNESETAGYGSNGQSGREDARKGADIVALKERLGGLDAEIAATQAKLTELEHRAKNAVQVEDADAVSAAWAEKRRLTEELDGLKDQRNHVQQELQQAFEERLASVKQEGEATMAQLRTEQDEGFTELGQLVGRIDELVRRLNQAPTTWSREQQAWQSRLDALLQEASPASTGLQAPAWAAVSYSEERSLSRDGEDSDFSVVAEENSSSEQQAVQAPTNPWTVYNPDTSRTVETLDELMNVLARWYPQKPAEERIREFLTLPKAEPMPERIKEELRGYGYQLP